MSVKCDMYVLPRIELFHQDLRRFCHTLRADTTPGNLPSLIKMRRMVCFYMRSTETQVGTRLSAVLEINTKIYSMLRSILFRERGGLRITQLPSLREWGMTFAPFQPVMRCVWTEAPSKDEKTSFYDVTVEEVFATHSFNNSGWPTNVCLFIAFSCSRMAPFSEPSFHNVNLLAVCQATPH